MAVDPVDLSELKARLCSLEIEALAALTPSIVCEAFPRWSGRSETGSYWINRTPLFSAEEAPDDYGDEGAVYIYTVNSAFIAAPSMSNFVGETEDLLDFIAPQVVEYIDARAHLQSVDYPNAMLFLERASFLTGGFTTVPAVGGTQAEAAAFQWRCKFRKPIEQVYL